MNRSQEPNQEQALLKISPSCQHETKEGGRTLVREKVQIFFLLKATEKAQAQRKASNETSLSLLNGNKTPRWKRNGTAQCW